jgi:hypothetical protein
MRTPQDAESLSRSQSCSECLQVLWKEDRIAKPLVFPEWTMSIAGHMRCILGKQRRFGQLEPIARCSFLKRSLAGMTRCLPPCIECLVTIQALSDLVYPSLRWQIERDWLQQVNRCTETHLRWPVQSLGGQRGLVYANLLPPGSSRSEQQLTGYTFFRSSRSRPDSPEANRGGSGRIIGLNVR